MKKFKNSKAASFVTHRHLSQFMYPGCLTCVAITWMNSSGASLCFNHMNEEFLGSNRLHISCCCFFFLSQHHKWLKLASSWFAAIGKNPVELWILPKCSANFLQIPGHNTCATYISFGSEPKQSPYIYHKCLCIYETTKTLGTFLHSCNFEIEVLDIATKRIQTPESKFNTSNSPELRQICSPSKAQNIISKHFWAYKTKVLVLYTLLNDKMQIKRKLNNPNVGKCLISFPKPTKKKKQIKILTTQSSGGKLDFKFLHQQKTNNQNQSPQNQGREKRFKDSF